jgi:hypothetical protein
MNIKNKWTDLEIINISTVNGRLVAVLSFKETCHHQEDLNNGYDTVEVPINIRKLQYSVRGNLLVDQSVKNETTMAENKNTKP